MYIHIYVCARVICKLYTYACTTHERIIPILNKDNMHNMTCTAQTMQHQHIHKKYTAQNDMHIYSHKQQHRINASSSSCGSQMDHGWIKFFLVAARAYAI
jgi:hypothetical protein